MLESKMPHVFLVFPPWFYQKYPELTKVLKINQERLTTNRDVYETIRDLVNFQATTGKGDLNKNGISLFYEIPRERTCEHADIPMEYCACQQMTAENIPLFTVHILAEGIVEKLREQVNSHRDKCRELRYQSTNSIMKIPPKAGLKGDRQEDMSIFQLTIVTIPGRAIYESVVKFWNSTKTVEVVGGITRLNMYKGQADCMDDPRLKPFCYCRKRK